jgi:hypothetical protein
MNKKIISFIGVIAIVVIAGWNYGQKQNAPSMSNLVLANVDALADGESEETYENRRLEITVESIEFKSEGVITVYRRNCYYGGSEMCSPGTWSDYKPR